VLVEERTLGRRGTSSKGRAHLEEGSHLLGRGALYGRWRVHCKGGHITLVSFFLSRGALELSAHHIFGGRLSCYRTVCRKGLSSLKARLKLA
jgi:hypothetical protein